MPAALPKAVQEIGDALELRNLRIEPQPVAARRDPSLLGDRGRFDEHEPGAAEREAPEMHQMKIVGESRRARCTSPSATPRCGCAASRYETPPAATEAVRLRPLRLVSTSRIDIVHPEIASSKSPSKHPTIGQAKSRSASAVRSSPGIRRSVDAARRDPERLIP